MKNDKIVKAAEKAREAGVKYFFSIVKCEGKTRLYHVVDLNYICHFKKWPTASIKIMDNGQPVIRATDKLPEDSISLVEALRKYK